MYTSKNTTKHYDPQNGSNKNTTNNRSMEIHNNLTVHLYFHNFSTAKEVGINISYNMYIKIISSMHNIIFII